ncbi:phospholipase D family protein [Marinobacter sp. VGCF2001]|uniref:phospholipase D family protein n=1 Tax=Marinobacter sp. VGCF2001 TaxID=3417189 RepID=UPI003CF5680B
MILDGDHISGVLSKAKDNVIICAPYIKKGTFLRLVNSVSDDVNLKIYTQWNPYDIAAGVSDIEVFDSIKDRKNSSMFLISGLHAKLFASDNEVWVGSANVTGAALGWSNNPNVEILVKTDWKQPSVRRILFFFEAAIEVDQEIYNRIAKESSVLKEKIPDIKVVTEQVVEETTNVWIPKCSVPEILFSIYSMREGNKYTASAISDAKSDIETLLVPQGLKEQSFNAYISDQLELSPLFSEILSAATSRLTEERGKRIISEKFPEADESELRLHWHVLIQWIKVFFKNKFEVAPASYEVRLK